MPSPLAIAADYADAMMIARRAKNWLFLFLSLMLIVQIATFFVARMTEYVIPNPAAESLAGTVTPTTAPATQPSESAAQVREQLVPVLQYVTAGINYLGVGLAIVLLAVLTQIMTIMLVGRLIGVSQVASAFVWCAFMIFLLFPSQAFWREADFTTGFKLPGILYTWGELVDPTTGAKFRTDKLDFASLRWARFVGWPVLTMILLFVVQAKSSRGLRAALGETELDTQHGDLHVS